MATVRPLGWFVLLTAAFAARADGQAVHVVAGDGSGDFVQLSHAVAAAADGDVILVRPHTQRYDALTINGRSLTIVGDGAERPQIEDVIVRDLAADDVVSLRFLDIQGRSEATLFGADQTVGISLLDDAGCVWLQDLLVAGGEGLAKLGGFEAGLPGMVIQSSGRVVMVDNAVRGGHGFWSVAGTSDPGGDGVRQIDSHVALHGCSIVGGNGGMQINPPAAQGGIGLVGSGAHLFASGSSLVGGDTGSATVPVVLPTASGLALVAGSSARTVETTLLAGSGLAPAGEPLLLAGLSTHVDQDDIHRAIHVPAALREGRITVLTYGGHAGDFVLLRFSGLPAWVDQPDLKGVDHLAQPTHDFVLGVAGPGGALEVRLMVPRLPVGVDAIVGYAQPLVRAQDGGLRLGAPSSLLIVDETLAPPRPPVAGGTR